MASGDPSDTVGALLQRALDAAGVGAVHGEAVTGLRVVPVPALGAARLLAAADARLGGGAAATSPGDGLLEVGGAGGEEVRVASAGDVAGLVPVLARGGPVRVRLDVDPATPLPSGAAGMVAVAPVPDRWAEPDEAVVAALGGARAPLVLAGPGVVADGAIPGLHALATAGDVGVLNTWGAKGVFDWRSRHHLATIGLQARDFELGGLGAADLVVAVGIDEREAPPAAWQPLAPWVEVPTGALSVLAERWRSGRRDIPVPPLRAGLARVTQAGWTAPSPPLAPTRVTRHYGDVVAAGGLVAADPGAAGFWVARTLGTTRPSAVHVPAAGDGEAGFAVACAVAARRRSPGRPVLAVLDGPPPDGGAVAEVVEAADRLGLGVGVEVWDPDAPVLDADVDQARLAALATAGPRCQVVGVATDPGQLDEVVAVAGPVTAWP